MADIFISYSRKDSEHATALAERLRAGSASVWLDTASLTAAETWSAEIVAAIKECSTFILLLSPDSVASRNVIKEVSLASERAKQIVPIILSPCELGNAMEYALAGLQQVAITNVEAFERLIAKLIGGASPAAAQPTAEPANQQIRIAIVPFEDQSAAHDNEWFADGLTDELISTLNRLDALFVLDRQSSKGYKSTTLSAKQIARELQVRYIISGAVRKAGDKLRIQATLIDGLNGQSLWDERFSGTMDDIFEIQEKTALDICAGLKLTLTPEEELLLEEKLTNSSEAYRLYLQALAEYPQDFTRMGSIELALKAVLIDPNFIPAHYLLSIFYSNRYKLSNRQEEHWLELSKQEIDKIKAIDPESYFNYGPLANYYLNIGQNERALEMAQKAAEMQPKRRSSYTVLGFIQDSLGMQKESVETYKQVIEIDPTELISYSKIIIYAYQTGDSSASEHYWSKAEHFYELALARNGEQTSLLNQYLVTAEFAEQHKAAVAIAEKLVTKTDLRPTAFYDIAWAFYKGGQLERAAQYLRLYIETGITSFDEDDVTGFAELAGTPEYQAILDDVSAAAAS